MQDKKLKQLPLLKVGRWHLIMSCVHCPCKHIVLFNCLLNYTTESLVCLDNKNEKVCNRLVDYTVALVQSSVVTCTLSCSC